MAIVYILIGLVLLVTGAEALVRGAVKSAAALGISPLIIGLTVVAFGTSAPEMAVSVISGMAGKGDIALGNAVGSNIFNVLLILGVSAVVIPLAVSTQLVRLDVPLMIAASLMLYVLGADGGIGHLDGLTLFSGIITYTVFLIIKSRKEKISATDEFTRNYGAGAELSAYRWWLNITLILAGLGLLVLGSHWLVTGAVMMAQRMGVSQLIIGLTIVAAGTSMPELATSIVASIRGERDIAVGNVVGSNLFNILAVIGLAGMVTPNGIPVAKTALHFDLPVMIAVSLACLPIFFSDQRIDRWEGALFLAYYAAYIVYIILAATRSPNLLVFTMAMTWFVLPLTVLTLLLITFRALRSCVKNPSKIR
jgi:cation:H+ antiporter